MDLVILLLPSRFIDILNQTFCDTMFWPPGKIVDQKQLIQNRDRIPDISSTYSVFVFYRRIAVAYIYHSWVLVPWRFVLSNKPGFKSLLIVLKDYIKKFRSEKLIELLSSLCSLRMMSAVGRFPNRQKWIQIEKDTGVHNLSNLSDLDVFLLNHQLSESWK